MPVNPYFQAGRGIGSRSEQRLLQNLVNEAIQIAGADFVYIPRELVNKDEIFHEDTISRFSKYYTIEMYIENYQEAEGEGEMITKFGFSAGFQLRLTVSVDRFALLPLPNGRTYPKEGDLIYYPTTKQLYEIRWINDTNTIYPLGSRQTFQLYVELYRYSHEDVQTGVLEIDEVVERYRPTDAMTVKDPFGKNADIQTKKPVVVDDTEKPPF
ncbi:MAG: hypothetical protein N3A54_00750 [Patescibacteria group bacterium]|nr:hypothetical protein [Patescibacteria group bacterium]